MFGFGESPSQGHQQDLPSSGGHFQYPTGAVAAAGGLPHPHPQGPHQNQAVLTVPVGPPNTSSPENRKADRSPFVQGTRVRTPKGTVNCRLEGPPSPAPLVLCIHGLNGSLSSFDRIQPALIRAGLRVLCYDLFGFGASASPSGRLDPTTYVEQVHSVLSEIGIPPAEQVMVVGFSMGGVIAVEFARRYPNKVQKLLLIAPGGLLNKSETPCRPLLFGCLRTPCGGCLLHPATCLACCCSFPVSRAMRDPEKLADSFELDVREPGNFREISRMNGERFYWNLRRSVNSYLRALRRMPLWKEDFQASYAELANSGLPLLFIWGDSDNTIPWSEVQHEVINLFGPRGVSCIMVNGGGHGMLVEDAEVIGNCAAAWFTNSPDPAWHHHLNYWRLPVPNAAPVPEVMGSATAM
eukprot:TRINITY_DN69851_c0_g1_i1.p1 TRINITY_DN69851_c0_g1~~TRINITY_DN69851_c0_g1_i1.p1  ORF type:complete len:409 (-),score=53.26 TRINITY_DN69851_c0_g1_i1:54-1280(-)